MTLVLGLSDEERDHALARARAPLTIPRTTAHAAHPAPEALAPRLALPAPPRLIGRQPDLEQLRQALITDGQRLVTLLGPGGIGKTVLALQAAVEVAGQLAGGAAFVALAAVRDRPGLVTAVTAAVGCPLAAGSPEEVLGDWLRERELLLVLDNFEQLLGPDRESLALLRALLGAGPGLRLLVTSPSGTGRAGGPPISGPRRPGVCAPPPALLRRAADQ